MKLIKHALAFALGGAVVHTFLGRARAGASDSDGPTGKGSRADTSPVPAAEGSPNAAERLQGRRPANALAGSEGLRADLLGSDAALGEGPRGTGLADFTRGA